MIAIDLKLTTPRPPQDPDTEVTGVFVSRQPDGVVLVHFQTIGNSQMIQMPQEVFDKLAIAVVKFIQSEAVKS